MCCTIVEEKAYRRHCFVNLEAAIPSTASPIIRWHFFGLGEWPIQMNKPHISTAVEASGGAKAPSCRF